VTGIYFLSQAAAFADVADQQLSHGPVTRLRRARNSRFQFTARRARPKNDFPYPSIPRQGHKLFSEFSKKHSRKRPLNLDRSPNGKKARDVAIEPLFVAYGSTGTLNGRIL
jgi:hypothetical protein